MQPKELERFAINLAQNCNKRTFKKLTHTNTSACYRTAISRLYYGILHQIKEWLSKRGFPLKEREIGRIHLIVRNRLKEIDPEAAKTLKQLHDLRKEADYELDIPIGYPEWKKAFWYAKILKRRLGL